MISTKPISKILESHPQKFTANDMEKIATEVREAAQKIITAKKATYYGIGIAITRIVRAILNDEKTVLTVSARLKGEYNHHDIFVGTPCIIGKNGVNRLIELDLSDSEKESFIKSCRILSEEFDSLNLKNK